MSPWTSRGWLGRKAFRDGAPDPKHWQAGFAQNTLHEPRDSGAVVSRVYPVEGSAGQTRAVRAVRTLEIAKWAGSDETHVFAAAAPGDSSWPAETGSDPEAGLAGPMPCASGAGAAGIDLEYANQLHGLPLDAGAPAVLEALGAVLEARRGDAAWLQAAFADRTEELAPVIARMGMEAARAASRGRAGAGLAERVSEACAARAHERHIAVSIRGVIASESPQAAIGALDAAAAGIRFGEDSLRVCSYGGEGVARWMAARDLAHESSIGIIGGNCRMWRDPERTMRWGAGRDMSPVLVLSPRELGALLAVPRAGSLHMRARRQRSAGAAEAVEGFDLA